MKVFGWPSDGGACRFYRTDVPAGALNGAGHDMTVSDNTRLTREVVEDPERLIVVQRSGNPSARRALEGLASEQGRPFVFDVDDWLWGVEQDNPAYRSYQSSHTRDTLDWMATTAAVVTCSTEPLAENIRNDFGRDAAVVPNALPADMIHTDYEERPPTILWRGSDTHRRDVQVLGYALQRAERNGVRIVFAGADYRKMLGLRNSECLDEILMAHPDWRDTARANCQIVPTDRYDLPVTIDEKGRPSAEIRGRRRVVWLAPDEYRRAVRELVRPTLCLAPLRGTRFNESKSHIAALEGHALGAPVLASDLPAYRWYLTAGGGLVRNQEDAWHRAIRDTLEMSYPEWRAVAEAGVARALETSAESLVDRYVAAYEQAGVPTAA